MTCKPYYHVRERLVGQRSGIINQKGCRTAGAALLARRVADDPRHALRRALTTHGAGIEDLAGDWRRLDDRIERLSGEIEALARLGAGCQQLMSAPGIGPIISSATVAAIGTGATFSKGHDFAAWLGLVPKQISTGDPTILGNFQSAAIATCASCLSGRRGLC